VPASDSPVRRTSSGSIALPSLRTNNLGLRRFLAAFKGNTLEVRAADFKVERLKAGSVSEAIAAYLRAAPYRVGPVTPVIYG
jgi:hypothetical protein